MEKEEFIRELEKILGIPQNSLTSETILSDISEWDSMAVLNVIAMVDRILDKEIDIAQFFNAKTVFDLYVTIFQH